MTDPLRPTAQQVTPPDGKAPSADDRAGRPQYLLIVILIGLILVFLFTLGLPVFIAGLALAMIALFVLFLPDFPEPSPQSKRGRRTWVIDAPSPVRQQVTITGTGRCTLRFWWREGQSMEYRYDILDGDGNDVPELPWSHGGGPQAHPGRLCWYGAEGGPGGEVYLVENPYWWKVTIRYQLRAPDDTKVRGVQMHVEIDPRGADVAFPDAPTSLPEPVVTWGRLNDPPEALKRNSSARV